MRRLSFLLAWLALALPLEGALAAVWNVSLRREVSYRGGLETPGMMEDSSVITAPGPFDADLGDTLVSTTAQSGAAASQHSTVDATGGRLFIQANADANAWASTDPAASDPPGTIADAIASSRLEMVVHTGGTAVRLTVDVAISSNLSNFYDGPGDGQVDTSHVASFTLCVVNGSCLADILVDDISDNLQAVADGVQDSIDLPPGDYELELLAISQAVSRDNGSTSGGAGFSAQITLESLPEPDMLLSAVTALGLIGALRRRFESLRD